MWDEIFGVMTQSVFDENTNGVGKFSFWNNGSFISIIRLKDNNMAMIIGCRPCRDSVLATVSQHASTTDHNYNKCVAHNTHTSDWDRAGFWILCVFVWLLPPTHNVQWLRIYYKGFKVVASLFLDCVKCRTVEQYLTFALWVTFLDVAIRDQTSGCSHHVRALTMTYLSHTIQNPQSVPEFGHQQCRQIKFVATHPRVPKQSVCVAVSGHNICTR